MTIYNFNPTIYRPDHNPFRNPPPFIPWFFTLPPIYNIGCRPIPPNTKENKEP